MKKFLLLTTLLCSSVFTNVKKVEVEKIDCKNNTILKSTKDLIVLDVYAQWCIPCKRMTPIFENAAQHFLNKVLFLKVEIDSFEQKDSNISWLKKSFNVTIDCIPTILIIKENTVKKVIKGSCSLIHLQKTINTLLTTNV